MLYSDEVTQTEVRIRYIFSRKEVAITILDSNGIEVRTMKIADFLEHLMSREDTVILGKENVL